MTSSNTSTLYSSQSNRNYKHFTEAECQYMLDHHKDMTAFELAKFLDRPTPSVRDWLARHSLSAKPAHKDRWLQWQIDVLIAMFKDTSVEDIAVLVGKSAGSVSCKAYKLRLLKDKEFASAHYKAAAQKRKEEGLNPFKYGRGNRKAIVVTDVDGVITHKFATIGECAKHFEVSYTTISDACYSIFHYTRKCKDQRFWTLKDYNKKHNTNIEIEWK